MPISNYGESNPDLSRFRVPEASILWRYMDIGKFLDLVFNRRIWFSRVIELRKTDPYEGTLTSADHASMKNVVEATSREYLRAFLNAKFIDMQPAKSLDWLKLHVLSKTQILDFNVKMNSVSCWHRNSTESDAMWALYAQRQAGVAIRTNLGRILKAFQSVSRSMSIGSVNYDSDSNLSALTPGIFDSILIKRHAFHHENEVRIIADTPDGYETPDWTTERQVYNLNFDRPVPPGVYVDCDLGSLIEEIVLSPLIPTHTLKALEAITQAHLPSTPIRKSSLLVQEPLIQTTGDLAVMLDHYRKTGLKLEASEIKNGLTPPMLSRDKPLN